MADETSIWKREISFRRKRKEPELETSVPPEPDQFSLMERISGGSRTPEEPEPARAVQIASVPPPAPEVERLLPHAAGEYEWRPASDPTAEPADRAADTDAPMPRNVVQLPPVAAAQHQPPPEPSFAAAPEPDDGAPAEAEKKSLLKREMSFGRRKRTEALDESEKKPRPEKRARKPKPKSDAPRGGSRRGKQLVGLKIGASQLAAARVSNNGAAELLQVARSDLRPGVVVGGELRDSDALAEALRAFFKEHRLPKRGVRLGIANNRIGVRAFEIAGVTDPRQLANAIRFRAQETLPIPIEEAVLDYRVLAEGSTDEGEPTRRVLLVVAYRDLVDRYLAACRKAGITVAGIDLEAFALLRSLSAPRGESEQTDAALVAVAIGHERSTLAVSDGRVCEFTRVLDWGGSSLNVAIARALDISPPEAEQVKRQLSLWAPSVPDGLTEEQARTAADAVHRQVQTFARELVSSLQFYQGQPGSLGIGEIVLSGGTAHLPGLGSELQRLIGVAVRIGDPLARVRVHKKVGDPEQIGSLAVAIGLGIED